MPVADRADSYRVCQDGGREKDTHICKHVSYIHIIERENELAGFLLIYIYIYIK